MRGESEASCPFDPSLDGRPWLRYAVAVGCLDLALALRFSLMPILGIELPTLTFFPAIVVSAWFGGFGPGLLATALSCVTVLYVFVEPIGRLAISHGESGFDLALLFGFGALTSFLTAAPRESERRSRPARLQAEAEARNASHASLLSIIRRAEGELRRSEAYLAEGQRLTHTGSWGWNAITGDIYWSREQYRIFGRDPQRGPPSLEEAFDLVHPDDCASVEEAFAEVLREGTDLEWDSRVIGSDGAIKYIHTTAHPMTASGELTEIVGTTMDTTERRQAEEERARLLHQVISAHEEERRRISREIHDELGQQVSAAVFKVSALKQDCANQPELCAQMESIEDALYHLDSSVDFLVWNIRPTALDGQGLAVALSHVIRHWSKHARAHAQLHTVGMEEHRLPADIEVALYRVVQEALNNIAKHADATNVHVFLECRTDHVSLIVEDDGKGFDADEGLSDEPGAGLFGMRERATDVGGTFEVESHRGRGTTLVLQIPLGGVSTEVSDDG